MDIFSCIFLSIPTHLAGFVIVSETPRSEFVLRARTIFHKHCMLASKLINFDHSFVCRLGTTPQKCHYLKSFTIRSREIEKEDQK